MMQNPALIGFMHALRMTGQKLCRKSEDIGLISPTQHFNIPIENPDTLDRAEVSAILHHLEGLEVFYLYHEELVVIFRREYAQKGVDTCRSLVNGSLPSTIP